MARYTAYQVMEMYEDNVADESECESDLDEDPEFPLPASESESDEDMDPQLPSPRPQSPPFNPTPTQRGSVEIHMQ